MAAPTRRIGSECTYTRARARIRDTHAALEVFRTVLMQKSTADDPLYSQAIRLPISREMNEKRDEEKGKKNFRRPKSRNKAVSINCKLNM